MEWLQLFLAGLAEIGWAVGLKLTNGLTRPLPTIGTILTMIVSFYFFRSRQESSRSEPAMQSGPASALWVQRFWAS